MYGYGWKKGRDGSVLFRNDKDGENVTSKWLPHIIQTQNFPTLSYSTRVFRPLCQMFSHTLNFHIRWSVLFKLWISSPWKKKINKMKKIIKENTPYLGVNSSDQSAPSVPKLCSLQGRFFDLGSWESFFLSFLPPFFPTFFPSAFPFWTCEGTWSTWSFYSRQQHGWKKNISLWVNEGKFAKVEFLLKILFHVDTFLAKLYQSTAHLQTNPVHRCI